MFLSLLYKSATYALYPFLNCIFINLQLICKVSSSFNAVNLWLILPTAYFPIVFNILSILIMLCSKIVLFVSIFLFNILSKDFLMQNWCQYSSRFSFLYIMFSISNIYPHEINIQAPFFWLFPKYHWESWSFPTAL